MPSLSVFFAESIGGGLVLWFIWANCIYWSCKLYHRQKKKNE